ncbi:MAG TPA: helix-turn-helix transcriptional regulator [Pseudonocardiaceae bacterium]|jgi:DNA-binding XRE family transcriptional regulator|nr:helix-turn-helix transcriptional regulator [Pseudonocardiaceae bacterium]
MCGNANSNANGNGNGTETAPPGSVGHRLARARKLAGLTQHQLAARAHVSKSLISQVERGVVPASPAFTAAVARGLGLEPQALTGEPYGPPITDPRRSMPGSPPCALPWTTTKTPISRASR